MYVENKLIIYFASYMTCHNGIHTYYTHAYIWANIRKVTNCCRVCFWTILF